MTKPEIMTATEIIRREKIYKKKCAALDKKMKREFEKEIFGPLIKKCRELLKK